MKKIGHKLLSHWKLILFLVSLLVFYFFVNKYLKNDISDFDELIYNLIISIQSNIITKVMKVITFSCNTLVLCIITLFILFFRKRKFYGLYVGLNLVSVSLLNTIVKVIVHRPRPIGINLITETGYSFPSGHAMVGIAFYGLLIYIINNQIIKKWIKITASVFLLLLIFCIGLSRIYLGVHYASDVIAGFALGCAYLIVFIKGFNHKIIYNNKI